jgi:two-component system sensor histidine kinase QseC
MKVWRITSIYQFLMLSLCLVMGPVMGIAAWSGYRASVHEIDEIFDARLAQYARLLAATTIDNTAAHIPVPEREVGWIGHKYEAKISFQIWKYPGQLLTASDNASAEPLADFIQGYQEKYFHDRQWRVFVLQDHATNHWLMVAEQYDVRLDLVRDIAGNAVFSPLLGTIVALLLMGWILRRGLSPLDRIADSILRRREDDLTPVAFDTVPEEVRVLVDNVNALLVRVQSSLERERRFTADAAHELKTPLAAVKLQLENFLFTARSEDFPLLKKLQQGMQEMQRMVEQLLVFNRLQPQYFYQHVKLISIVPLCRDILSQEADMALQKQQDLELEVDGECLELNSDPAVLQILLRNLLRNAILYTPAGGVIVLRLSGVRSGSTPGVLLEVVDTGPGIPVEERGKVFERFYRMGGDSHASGTAGSGLGLAIVQEIVALHGGTIHLEEGDGGRGLRVRIFLPSVPHHSHGAC